jgi:hypothetical protein
MRTALRALAAGMVLLAATTGCEREAGPAAVPQLPDVPERAEEFGNKSVYYRCEGGFEVVVAGDTVQVALPDGGGVSLTRDASGNAMEFTGEALSFSVAGGAAVLTQDEGGRFACTGVD